MSRNSKTAASFCLRSAIVALTLTAVTVGALLASQPASAEEKSKTPVVTRPNADTSGIQRSRTPSADRNAEAVRSLL